MKRIFPRGTRPDAMGAGGFEGEQMTCHHTWFLKDLSSAVSERISAKVGNVDWYIAKTLAAIIRARGKV